MHWIHGCHTLFLGPMGPRFGFPAHNSSRYKNSSLGIKPLTNKNSGACSWYNPPAYYPVKNLSLVLDPVIFGLPILRHPSLRHKKRPGVGATRRAKHGYHNGNTLSNGGVSAKCTSIVEVLGKWQCDESWRLSVISLWFCDMTCLAWMLSALIWWHFNWHVLGTAYPKAILSQPENQSVLLVVESNHGGCSELADFPRLFFFFFAQD